MRTALRTEELISELQSFGARMADPEAGVGSRRGGAGPSDHKAMTIDGMTVMVPVHTAPAFESPYFIEPSGASGRSRVMREGLPVGEVSFPLRPRFYDLETADGIAYSKIAVLHGRDVLATTVLQSCVRYQSRAKTCQFCAIGQSLAAGSEGGGGTRRREAHGHDHRDAAWQGSRRRHPRRERCSCEGRGHSAGPGAVRAAG
jgi:radical SAM protein (TIGR04043 family)